MKLGDRIVDLAMCGEGKLSLNGMAMVSQRRGKERKEVAPPLKESFGLLLLGFGEEGRRGQLQRRLNKVERKLDEKLDGYGGEELELAHQRKICVKQEERLFFYAILIRGVDRCLPHIPNSLSISLSSLHFFFSKS